MAWRDLTTLYRGEPSPFSSLGRSNIMKGRWFTPNPEFARGYANYPGGIVRSMKVTPSELEYAQKFKNYLKYTKGMGARISPNPEVVISPRSLLNRASINWGQTLKHNVDVSKLAAQLYGPEILKKGLRSLSFLGSLPAQAGLMTLMPTTANVDEADMTWEDFKKLQMVEKLLAKRRNIPGTPIVPMDRGRDRPNIPGTPIVPMDKGRDEPDRGGSERTFSRTSPGGISQATSRAARSGMSGWRLAHGGMVDKSLSGRSRDI